MEMLPRGAFRKNRLLRDGAWVVAFLADWCPFCRRFQPQFEALDENVSFRTGVGDVSAEESPLWDDFSIEVVPALAVFRGGRLVFRVDSEPGVGLPPSALEQARAAALSDTA